jgi:hypothetical protein
MAPNTTVPDTRRDSTLAHRAPVTRRRARGGIGKQRSHEGYIVKIASEAERGDVTNMWNGPYRGDGRQQPKRKLWGRINAIGKCDSDVPAQRPIKQHRRISDGQPEALWPGTRWRQLEHRRGRRT